MFRYWCSKDGKYSYFTRGCAANAEEAHRLMCMLKPYFDEFLIINSCILKEKQEYSLLECLKEVVKRKPKGFKVFITGCSATVHPDWYEKYGKVISNEDKFKLSSYGIIGDPGKVIYLESDVAMLEIQEGCNSHCSYCAVPSARGKSKSVPYPEIKSQIKEMIKQNKFEIRLVGTNLTQYNSIYEKKPLGLFNLCKQILEDFPEIKSLQTDFIEPESKDLDKLINLCKLDKRLSQRFDIGVQSFCDKTLRKMNRGSTKRRLIELYKLAGNEVMLVPDIIVGFPGETEEDFKENLDFIKEYKIKDVHVHLYSKRDGTPAASMPDQISEEVKHERAQRIKDLFKNDNRNGEIKFPRFVQFELTKNCNNNCLFCYNSKDLNKKEDKVQKLLDVHAFLSSDEIKNYDGVGLIGGELFDGQFGTYVEKLLFRELFSTILYMLHKKPVEIRIATALMFSDPTFMLESLKGDGISGLLDYSSYVICTSYDTKGRFTTKEKLENWQKNMKLLYRELPGVKLHTEIILTEDFCQKVISGKFNLEEFRKEFNTGIDFIEPNSGFYYKDKYEMSKYFPWFFPKRDTFLNFIQKLKEINYPNLDRLLDYNLKSDTLFMEINGKMERFDNRNTIRENLPCNIPEKSGYIDSDKNMRDDALLIVRGF